MGWLRRLIGLEAMQPPAPSARSDDAWQPGDLAECIHSGPWWFGGLYPHADGPQLGEQRIVEAAPFAIVPFTGERQQFLRFKRYAPAGYQAVCFRKVTPRADEAIAGDAASLRDLLNQPVNPELVQ